MKKTIKISLAIWCFAACVVSIESAPMQYKRIPDAAAAEKIFAENGDPVMRRTAFRFLLEDQQTTDNAIQKGLKDSDPVIRSRSVLMYFNKNGENALPLLREFAPTADPFTLEAVFLCANSLNDNAKRMEVMKLIAKNPNDCETKRSAVKISGFNFYRNNKRLKDDPAYDREVVTIKSIPLPLSGWAFNQDKNLDGHRQGWFKVNWNDSKWAKLKIGCWEDQGFANYDGIAWYRLNFSMPSKLKDFTAVELYFQAVDESAWVWLNGKYIGQHDVGPDGWDKPFWLDVTKEINWDGENVLTVRVEDTQYGGGIWKPVSVEILK